MNLILGDCVEVLKTLEPDSVDSLVTDPPAGISFMGKSWDSDKGGRKEWIAWMSEVMKECLRVMKPGAHGLIWAIPRTSHWTATALEDAGFEVRDVITHLFGQGFPKSLDISKAIDKAAGAKREVGPDIRGNSYSGRGISGTGTNNRMMTDITTASTPEAKQWEGWGTALKPAAEFWVLVRKPCSEKTVAANVLKWGTGGLNIDGSRILSDGKRPDICSSCEKSQDASSRTTISASQSGRFPSNLVLSHSPYCTDETCDLECAIQRLDEQSGVSVSRPHKNKAARPSGTFNASVGEAFSPHSDSGGASRFFYCAKISSGERNAGFDKSDLIWESEVWEKQGLNSKTVNILQLARDTSEGISMEGSSWSTDLYGHSISEQYPQGFKFTTETVLKLITELRTSNVSQLSNIKENIQVAIKTIEANGLSLAESVAFTSQLNLDSIRGETASLLRVVIAVLQELLPIRNAARTGNFHATVKPKKLMGYLIKLITPPNGTVLDPFMGSGSTGLAARENDFQFIGIEKEQEYFEIAEKRLQ